MKRILFLFIPGLVLCGNLFSQEPFKNKANGLWGLKKDGKIILPPLYSKIEKWKHLRDSSSYFINAFLITQNRKVGIVNADGKILLKPGYDWIDYQCQNGHLIKVEKNNQKGFIDYDMKVVFPCLYTINGNFSDHTALFYLDSKPGIVSDSGKIILPFRDGSYNEFKTESGKRFFFKSFESVENPWQALYDNKGKEIISRQNGLDYNYYTDALIWAEKNGKQGAYDLDGNEKIPFIYEYLILPRNLDLLYYNVVATSAVTLPGTPYLPVLYPGKKNKKGSPRQVVIDTSNVNSVKTLSGVKPPKVINRCTSNGKYIFYKLNGKWGLMSAAGEKKSEAVYDTLISGGQLYYVKLIKNQKHGLIDSSGKELFAPVYDAPIDLMVSKENDILTVIKNNKAGLIRKNGEEVCPIVYDKIEYSGRAYKIIKDGKEGRIESSGKISIPPVYEKIEAVKKSDLYIVTKNGLQGVITGNDKEIIPCIYDEISYNKFRDASDKKISLFTIELNGEYDKMNKDGTVYRNDEKETQKNLDYNYELNNKLAEDGSYVNYQTYYGGQKKYGIQSKDGKDLVPFEYEDIKYYDGESAAAKKNGVYTFINKKGEPLSAVTYEKVIYRNADQFIVGNEKKYGVINKDGKVIIPLDYDFVQLYTNNLYKVEKDNLCGLIRPDGSKVTEVVFQNIFYNDMLQMIPVGNDTSGTKWDKFMIIRKNVDDAGLVRKYALIRSTGEMLTDFIFEKIRFQRYKPTEFMREGNWYYLDKNAAETDVINLNSKKVIAAYDFLKKSDDPGSNLYYAKKNGKSGIIDFNTKIIVPFAFDTIFKCDANSNVVRTNGKYGLIDGLGKIIIPQENDTLFTDDTFLYSQDAPELTYLSKGGRGMSFYRKDFFVVVRKDGKFGAFTKNGKKITEAIYDDFQSSAKWPSCIFKRGGVWYVIDELGKEHKKPGTRVDDRNYRYGTFIRWDF